MSILDDLYSGRIYPLEKIIPKDPNYRSVSNEIGELRKFFREKTAPEDKEKFNRWNQLIHEAHYMECYENFAYGFRLGALLFTDVISGYEPTER